jgi:hypothetical protein
VRELALKVEFFIIKILNLWNTYREYSCITKPEIWENFNSVFFLFPAFKPWTPYDLVWITNGQLAYKVLYVNVKLVQYSRPLNTEPRSVFGFNPMPVPGIWTWDHFQMVGTSLDRFIKKRVIKNIFFIIKRSSLYHLKSRLISPVFECIRKPAIFVRFSNALENRPYLSGFRMFFVA